MVLPALPALSRRKDRTYVEQVRIEKNNLTLYSSVPLQAVIKAPPLMTQPNSVVLVRNARNDAILRFTITGPYTFSGCAEAVDRHTGVRVINGSAAIAGNHITEIRDVLPALYGCQDGIAVLVGRDTAAGVLLFETSANVVVRENDLRRNGVGIDIDEGAVGLVVRNNTVHKSHNDGLLAYTGASPNRIERNDAFDTSPSTART